MTSVTAALIVRDEEYFLQGCLDSLAGCVDEIVVVDTGSTDATIDIARSAGVRLSAFEWIGDFSAARNSALDLVKTSWVLYIDADERVTVPGNRRIADVIDPAKHAGGFVRFQPRPGYTRYREPRLFKSHPEIRFRGRIHESMLPDLLAFAGARHLEIASTEVCIDHYGFEGAQSCKIDRNIPLLEAELLANPGRAYCWHHLAEMHVLAGHRERAIDICRQGLSNADNGISEKDRIDRHQLTYTLARLLVEDGKDATKLIDVLLEDGVKDFSVLYLKGRALLMTGDYQGALAIGQSLHQVDVKTLDDSLTAYDMRLFGEFAWALVAAAHYRAGDHICAAKAYRQAWLLAPDNRSYFVKSVGLAGGERIDPDRWSPAVGADRSTSKRVGPREI